MYLFDTNVVSELRKGKRANAGVVELVRALDADHARVYLSVVTLGELRRGVDLLRYRGDRSQAERLERWLNSVMDDYANRILDFGRAEALLWGRLRVPHPENVLDKQIAATALISDLTVVTRNTGDFSLTGVKLLNPFSS
ncbi:type II toxin-antitoxin system VapC family toxin [Lamprobacter modestohalophilus]|uniref:type II toxin-antitoxin system VapC family toxin n=1 Tax=Lamprobacter modestohalophilus TaxID=1064514 RepID=UPI002ADECC38|nr:type II toxin-antitoxin system VapC family toxin [Lamprobacter modestohalophilus]MEA1050756.1 type II toxin-antitoxin system VapC family toxin [Lamprobacter modestohalophilus]